MWRGSIEKAYHFVTMFQLEKSLSSSDTFQPWTYPPQFDLLVAPLGLLPLGLAYSVFMIGTLAAYLATLRRIAAENFVSVLILLAPVIVITVRCGQNGFFDWNAHRPHLYWASDWQIIGGASARLNDY